MPTYLDFEAPVAELEGKIAELRALAASDKTVSISDEVRALEVLARLTLPSLACARCRVARCPHGRHPGV